MDPQEAVLEIERRAWEARVSIRSLCQKAGIHPSTFWRWKKSDTNPEPVVPNLATVNKLHAALDQIAKDSSSRGTCRGRKAAA